PATVVWVEALDQGNPKNKAPHRDRVLRWQAPFKEEPVELAKTVHRFAGLNWEEKGELALLRETDRDRRWERTFLVQVKEPGQPPRVLWDHSMQDRYRHPGTPVSRTLLNGHQAILRQGNNIYLTGQGGTPRGDRPFLDRLDLTTRQSARLFQ